MTDSTTFPESPEALTAEWLTAALGANRPWGGRVLAGFESERIGAAFGLDGVLHRVVPHPSDGAVLSSVVLKWSAAAGARREGSFLTRFGPLLGDCVPRCFGSFANDATGRGLVLLEDLGEVRQGDVLAACTADETKKLRAILEQTHALGAAAGEDAGLPRWRPVRPVTGDAWKGSLEAARVAFPMAFRPGQDAGLDGMPENVALSAERLLDAPATVIHGEVHLDNVLFRPSGALILIDWQSAAVGPAAVDQARMLVEAAPLGTPVPASADGLADAVELLAYGMIRWAAKGRAACGAPRVEALCEQGVRKVLAVRTALSGGGN